MARQSTSPSILSGQLTGGSTAASPGLVMKAKNSLDICLNICGKADERGYDIGYARDR